MKLFRKKQKKDEGQKRPKRPNFLYCGLRSLVQTIRDLFQTPTIEELEKKWHDEYEKKTREREEGTDYKRQCIRCGDDDLQKFGFRVNYIRTCDKCNPFRETPLFLETPIQRKFRKEREELKKERKGERERRRCITNKLRKRKKEKKRKKEGRGKKRKERKQKQTKRAKNITGH